MYKFTREQLFLMKLDLVSYLEKCYQVISSFQYFSHSQVFLNIAAVRYNPTHF